MEWLDALLLGLVQGLTEYLPVSSSGHLAIASHLFGYSNGKENLTFTVAVHVATVLSTIVVLWREIWLLLKGTFVMPGTEGANLWQRLTPEQRYVLCILVSMIPIGIVGVCFKDVVKNVFGSGLLIVGICLLCTAALLAFSYYSKPRERQNVTLKDAVIIGLAQAVAVLPGLSRSGSTIGTGLILGVSKERLAQFSFLMVIPPILGEALLDTLKMMKGEEQLGSILGEALLDTLKMMKGEEQLGSILGEALLDTLKMMKGEEQLGSIEPLALLVGFAAAFLSGCFACKVMINLVKRGKMIWFAAYCTIAGILTLAFAL